MSKRILIFQLLLFKINNNNVTKIIKLNIKFMRKVCIKNKYVLVIIFIKLTVSFFIMVKM